MTAQERQVIVDLVFSSLLGMYIIFILILLIQFLSQVDSNCCPYLACYRHKIMRDALLDLLQETFAQKFL